MNIYQRLKSDHERQKDLAEQLMHTSGDSDERQQLFAAFRTEVDAHAAAEEEVFYAALISEPDGQEKARHSVAEHKEAADLIEELEELDFSSGGWIHKFEKLKEELEHHVEEEEEEVFPLARSLFDDQEAEQMGQKFEERKTAECA